MVRAGDLVELAYHVTRKGRPEEDQMGLVVEIKETNLGDVAIINFGGILCKYPCSYLRVINEK